MTGWALSHCTTHNAAASFYSGRNQRRCWRIPASARRLDLLSLYQYLTYEYVPTPRSIYAGISKVRPGHTLVVERGQVSEQSYWDLDLSPGGKAATASVADLAYQLWSTLREAVRLELVSDVPLGIFLSGGIDSSAVALAATELQASSVRTFSIGFRDPSFDESAHARRVAAYLGTQHSELILKPSMLWELIPTLASLVDEPLADASILPTYLLSRFTRQHVTVALGGDGGDELFAGDSSIQAHRLASVYRHIPEWLRTGVISPLVNAMPVSLDNMSLDFRAKRFITGMDRTIAERHHLWLGAYSPQEKEHLLAPDILAQMGGPDTFDVLGEHTARSAGLRRSVQGALHGYEDVFGG